VTSAESAKAAGKKPLGSCAPMPASVSTLTSWGSAPPAIRKALERAGMKPTSWICSRSRGVRGAVPARREGVGLDRERVNVTAAPIGLGHPLGATGIASSTTLLLELEKRKKRFGVASACIGGGQGIAVIVERRTGR